jgi:glucose-6-phosphate 1-dehydrogenase
MIRRMVVFGATGDLVGRYLMRALAQLLEAGWLPEGFFVTGAATHEMDTATFRDLISERLSLHAPMVSEEARSDLVERLEYVPTDVTEAEAVARAVGTAGGEPLVAYLALPPGLFLTAVESLAEAGLPEGSKLVIEKPFGQDLASARKLNGLLHETFPESAIFRADHFLGEQTVQNILGLRFANSVFEPIWSRNNVERVEIIWDETLALEGRAGFYDSTGALKDMIQSHLLQLLALTAMDPPIALNERDLRNRKVDVFRAVKDLSLGDEEGIDPERGTETFAQVALEVDNWRWAGVPFVLRSGKALGRDRREISVHFRPVPHLTFGQDSDPEPNVLRLGMSPDTMSLGININGPGDPFDLEPVRLDAELTPQRPSEYGRVLLAVLSGNAMLSIRADEAEECWRIVEPILDAWEAGAVPLLEYPAGSDGPPRRRRC